MIFFDLCLTVVFVDVFLMFVLINCLVFFDAVCWGHRQISTMRTIKFSANVLMSLLSFVVMGSILSAVLLATLSPVRKERWSLAPKLWSSPISTSKILVKTTPMKNWRKSFLCLVSTVFNMLCCCYSVRGLSSVNWLPLLVKYKICLTITLEMRWLPTGLSSNFQGRLWVCGWWRMRGAVHEDLDLLTMLTTMMLRR